MYLEYIHSLLEILTQIQQKIDAKANKPEILKLADKIFSLLKKLGISLDPLKNIDDPEIQHHCLAVAALFENIRAGIKFYDFRTTNASIISELSTARDALINLCDFLEKYKNLLLSPASSSNATENNLNENAEQPLIENLSKLQLESDISSEDNNSSKNMTQSNTIATITEEPFEQIQSANKKIVSIKQPNPVETSLDLLPLEILMRIFSQGLESCVTFSEQIKFVYTFSNISGLLNNLTQTNDIEKIIRAKLKFFESLPIEIVVHIFLSGLESCETYEKQMQLIVSLTRINTFFKEFVQDKHIENLIRTKIEKHGWSKAIQASSQNDSTYPLSLLLSMDDTLLLYPSIAIELLIENKASVKIFKYYFQCNFEKTLFYIYMGRFVGKIYKCSWLSLEDQLFVIEELVKLCHEEENDESRASVHIAIAHTADSLLIDKYISVESINNYNNHYENNTLLQYIILGCFPYSVNIAAIPPLIKRGASVNTPCGDGKHILHHLFKKARDLHQNSPEESGNADELKKIIEIIETLIANGLQLNYAQAVRNDLIYLATIPSEIKELVKILLSFDDINIALNNLASEAVLDIHLRLWQEAKNFNDLKQQVENFLTFTKSDSAKKLIMDHIKEPLIELLNSRSYMHFSSCYPKNQDRFTNIFLKARLSSEQYHLGYHFGELSNNSLERYIYESINLNNFFWTVILFSLEVTYQHAWKAMELVVVKGWIEIFEILLDLIPAKTKIYDHKRQTRESYWDSKYRTKKYSSLFFDQESNHPTTFLLQFTIEMFLLQTQNEYKPKLEKMLLLLNGRNFSIGKYGHNAIINHIHNNLEKISFDNFEFLFTNKLLPEKVCMEILCYLINHLGKLLENRNCEGLLSILELLTNIKPNPEILYYQKELPVLSENSNPDICRTIANIFMKIIKFNGNLKRESEISWFGMIETPTANSLVPQFCLQVAIFSQDLSLIVFFINHLFTYHAEHDPIKTFNSVIGQIEHLAPYLASLKIIVNYNFKLLTALNQMTRPTGVSLKASMAAKNILDDLAEFLKANMELSSIEMLEKWQLEQVANNGTNTFEVLRKEYSGLSGILQPNYIRLLENYIKESPNFINIVSKSNHLQTEKDKKPQNEKQLTTAISTLQNNLQELSANNNNNNNLSDSDSESESVYCAEFRRVRYS